MAESLLELKSFFSPPHQPPMASLSPSQSRPSPPPFFPLPSFPTIPASLAPLASSSQPLNTLLARRTCLHRHLLRIPPSGSVLGPVLAAASRVGGRPAGEEAERWTGTGLGAEPEAQDPELRFDNGRGGSLYMLGQAQVDSLAREDNSLALAVAEDSDDDTSDDETDDIVYDVDELVETDDEDIDLDGESSGYQLDHTARLNSGGVFDDGKGKLRRFQSFLKRSQKGDDYVISLEDLTALYDFPIDRFQWLAIEAFLKGSSVVVCAPTSSGKTLIAETAAAATLSMRRRLYYTTPLKALSNQKLREFREMFGEENVGLLTGDAAVNRDAPILIMTTEILRNMLYQSVGTLEEGGRLYGVHAIVLDEVHYLSDISRGTVWEETVIYCPKEVQLICLSATVANPEDLAGWIAQVHGPTELVTSKRRPVPLTWHFSTRYSLSPLLNEQATDMNRRLSLVRFQENSSTLSPWEVLGDVKRKNARGNSLGSKKKPEPKGRQRRRDGWEEFKTLSEEEMQFLRRKQVPQVRDTLMQLKSRGMLPAIWFIFSRRGCDMAVQYSQVVQLLSGDEQRQVREAVQKFRMEYPEAVRESAVLPLLQGVAAHHAGCLPLWKAFIEELFQRALIKIVFATETLAAGINMPARTTVLSSLSKRGDNGHSLLSSNAMLQMAGRAGRRGIDEIGHVVFVQTPFEGAEECCKLFFAGPDPLVSQFTASYGMVLNLLEGTRLTTEEVVSTKRGRTLEEARALVERSFGNFLGSEVMLTARHHLSKLDESIEKLQKQCSPNLENRTSKEDYEEYVSLRDEIKQEKHHMRDLRQKLEDQRLSVVEPILDESLKEHLPFVCLCYRDVSSGNEILVPAMCFDIVPHPPFAMQHTMIDSLNDVDNNEAEVESQVTKPESSGLQSISNFRFYVALGSNNMWYMFSGRSVKSIHRSGLTNTPVIPGDLPLKEILNGRLPFMGASWQNMGRSGGNILSNVWCVEGSGEMFSWSAKIPPLDNLKDEYKMPQELLEAEKLYMNQRKRVSKLKKRVKSTKVNKEYLQLVGLESTQSARIASLEEKRSRLISRMSQMQPSGWKEFLQVLKVLEDAGAISTDAHELLPLGKTAARIRGVNELWMAVAFTDTIFLTFNPAQLAAVCGSLVTEGIKMRFDGGPSDIYQTSSTVEEAVEALEERRQWLLGLQRKHGVDIPCDLDDQLAGMVEAWASGVTWKELMMDSVMDEGDVARLLRRSIDLLAQLPHLQHLHPTLQNTARAAATVMDRSPISELIV